VLRLTRLLLISIGFLCLAVLSASASDLKVTEKPAPDREGRTGYACPPNFDPYTGDKQKFNHDIYGERKEYGDDEKRGLYYEGETYLLLKADDGTETDLKVIEWCKANPAHDRGHVTEGYEFVPTDYFTYEILTSKGGVETVQVPAGGPT
jgi:hypothetical protein